MNNIFKRQQDILSIISSLDISPTMHRNAEEKYKAITDFLISNGIIASMYPQGSFALGTVVRPIKKDATANYDLDFICQVVGSRSDMEPEKLRKQIETTLRSSEVYSKRLTVYDECFTIEYSDVNNVGFSIDIVPAVDESPEVKLQLIENCSFPELIDTAIAIPKYEGINSYWLTNNPKGFRKWFDGINEPFLKNAKELHRQRIFEQNRSLYSTVEEVPKELDRSPLQRVIQIIKLHRDSYYSKISDGDNIKPISPIINTIVAEIAKGYQPSSTVFDLLDYVLKEIEIYAGYLIYDTERFQKLYESRFVISRPKNKWRICNPANPEDNLADKWNENARIPEVFFQWIRILKTDLIKLLAEDDDIRFRTILENSFGNDIVNSVLKDKYISPNLPKPINEKTAPRPYYRDF